MDNTKALTVQDVADMLKIAKNTVYELVKRGELNSYKVGRKVRFTLVDVESYIENSKKIQNPQEKGSTGLSDLYSDNLGGLNKIPAGNDFIVCGQDLMLDILTSYMGKYCKNISALRAYIGSYSSLVALYHGYIQAATTHLWDGDTGQYNVPFVRRLLPGIPAVIIHLTCRMQGFYVAKGNPKGIKSWDDLKRDDITLINREKGAGSRVLLDEHLRLINIYGSSVKGYNNETQSHLTVASTVSRGAADVGVGIEKIASQVEGIEFIPLQKERYDLVVKKEIFDTFTVQSILKILRSDEFRAEFKDIGGYDISEMGEIVAWT
ncbi:helix-turn-helix transcriptional regulator [Sebaldella sp. S0638]|uniref:substrate-binding domain-containing protein n=1 Tax=Sebaldella sp. S0638 TaxID=2957809 RepID=UPI00209E2C6F|nr:helix-turn-helix transcriptional regulator [Sebaldella sp. S0638]MCP1224606.1 helix-turn-helix transcriptional regulator [Sebaldella sp. S0638]